MWHLGICCFIYLVFYRSGSLSRDDQTQIIIVTWWAHHPSVSFCGLFMGVSVNLDIYKIISKSSSYGDRWAGEVSMPRCVLTYGAFQVKISRIVIANASAFCYLSSHFILYCTRDRFWTLSLGLSCFIPSLYFSWSSMSNNMAMLATCILTYHSPRWMSNTKLDNFP